MRSHAVDAFSCTFSGARLPALNVLASKDRSSAASSAQIAATGTNGGALQAAA